MRFNPPPNWPPVPPNWTPPQGWQPDPAWGPPPPGWQLWTEGQPVKKPIYRRPWFIALAVVLVLGAIWSQLGGSDEPIAAPVPSPVVTTTAAAPTTTEPAPETTTEPAPEPTLTEVGAAQACASEAEQQMLRAGGRNVKVHWMVGVIANELRDDGSRFVKVQATVDKADYVVECSVAGTDDEPVVSDVMWY